MLDTQAFSLAIIVNIDKLFILYFPLFKIAALAKFSYLLANKLKSESLASWLILDALLRQP